MNYKIIYYKDIAPEEWDWNNSVVPESTYYHANVWLHYAEKIARVIENYSFICTENNDTVAIVPLMITESDNGNIFAAGGNPMGTPALYPVTHRERTKLLEFIFDIMKQYAIAEDVKEGNFIWYPVNLNNDYWPHANMFEMLRFNMEPTLMNTIVIDLERPVEELEEELGKYRRRHIKRSIRDGLNVEVFENDLYGRAREQFDLFHKIHYKAAGNRETRPQSTWDEMLDIVRRGDGTLFGCFIEDKPLAYLFCGEFSKNAFGWSQANDKEYEKQFSPRHLLEWEAILHYKERGFKTYEVGDRPFVGTEKELSIAEFKEKYGGVLLPKIFWRWKI